MLLQATASTLHVTNQKNGAHGQVVHNGAIHLAHCPICSLTRRVHSILATSANNSTLISFYTAGHQLSHILASDINAAVKTAIQALQLHCSGFGTHLIGSHSLRMGGAMALKLAGVDSNSIKKHGCWTLDAFLGYLHSQVAGLSSSLLLQMSQPNHF